MLHNFDNYFFLQRTVKKVQNVENFNANLKMLQNSRPSEAQDIPEESLTVGQSQTPLHFCSRACFK